MKRLSVNLATVPFVNRALPLGALATVGGAAAILTIFNLVSFIILGGEYRSQRQVLKHQEERIATLEKDLSQKRSVLQSGSVATFSGEALFISELLAKKRFSWVTFLRDLERVKAYGTSFQAVSPQVDGSGVIRVSIRGQANPRAELMKLEQNMFGDPHFKEVQLAGEQKDASGPIVTFSISCVYLPEGGNDAP
jgi:type IV pilus assembly protein PilN